jgi:hypothetical protein
MPVDLPAVLYHPSTVGLCFLVLRDVSDPLSLFVRKRLQLATTSSRASCPLQSEGGNYHESPTFFSTPSKNFQTGQMKKMNELLIFSRQ